MLPVGGTYQGYIYGYTCQDRNAVLQPTTDQFTAGMYPSGVQSETFLPNPSSTDIPLAPIGVQTTQFLVATMSAQPGDYYWQDQVTQTNYCDPFGINGDGYIPDGVSIVYDVQIVQSPPTFVQSDPNYLFYFNGVESPKSQYIPGISYYPTTAQLILPNNTPPTNHIYTPMSSSFGPFHWVIQSGTDKLEFWMPGQNGAPGQSLGSSTDTADPIITVHSLAASTGTQDIEILVTAPSSGFAYPPYYMTVYAPSHNVQKAGNPFCTSYPGSNQRLGYFCKVYGTVLDQFGEFFASHVAPTAAYQNYVTLNENFTVQTYNKATWPVPVPCGESGCSSQPPTGWFDQLTEVDNVSSSYSEGGCAKPDFHNPSGHYYPQPIPPQTPFCTGNATLYRRAFGGWWVGSAMPGVGSKIESNVWNSHLDHGNHTPSPP